MPKVKIFINYGRTSIESDVKFQFMEFNIHKHRNVYYRIVSLETTLEKVN